MSDRLSLTVVGANRAKTVIELNGGKRNNVAIFCIVATRLRKSAIVLNMVARMTLVVPNDGNIDTRNEAVRGNVRMRARQPMMVPIRPN